IDNKLVDIITEFLWLILDGIEEYIGILEVVGNVIIEDYIKMI
ncbi:6483_t:CDS:1, partial [Racocetra persica]